MSNLEQIVEVIETYRADIDALIENESEEMCISILQTMTDAYENDISTSEQYDWSDALFDSLHKLIKDNYPENPFFVTVGSTVRTGKIDLPYQMGSLNQEFTDSDIANWVSRHNLQKETFVIMAKYDGNASEVLYDSSTFIKSFSRGNGTQGADTSRHMRYVLPKYNIDNSAISKAILELGSNKTIAIRGEFIWSKSGFAYKGHALGYKNGRNAVSGLMNKTDSDPILHEIDYIPFTIDTISGQMDKVKQLELLKDAGFKPTRYVTCTVEDLVCSKLEEIIIQFKKEVDYELDGIVIEVNSHITRNAIQPNNSSLNPEYAIKFKMNKPPSVTTVIGVEWNCSKHGYLKPTVLYKPVDIDGVTCERATGFNARFILENKVGAGATIQLIRAGDVTPRILSVSGGTVADLPEDDGTWHWSLNDNDEEVDIILNDLPVAAKLLKMANFAKVLKISHLGEGNINKIHQLLGITDTDDLLKVQRNNWVTAVGSNGDKIYDKLQEKLANVDECVLASASGCFERGIGTRKLKSILQQTKCPLTELTQIKLLNVRGVADKTMERVISGLDNYFAWLYEVDGYVNIIPTYSNAVKKYTGLNVVFTGFRNDDLQGYLETNGAGVKSTVSKTTNIIITPDKNANSTKLKQARKLIAEGANIEFMTVAEFKDKYISKSV